MDIAADQLTVEHISLLYTVFKRVTNGKTVQTPNIVLNNLWVENITRSKAMREQISIFCAFDTSFEDINALKQELAVFVSDPQNSRDYHSDIEVEVVGIAEMNKLELRCELRHKSNWSNESLRAARRSKFMCALVLALRKVPIAGPGGSDAALGDANKPSWSVAISPEAAQAVRQKYLDDKDAARLNPTNKKTDEDEGTSTGVALGSEGAAINEINNRKPGVDAVRDDTWKTRPDDASIMGRSSMDGRPSMQGGRPEIDDLRGLLHKASSGGRRKGGSTLSPYSTTEPRQGMPPLPLAVNPSPNTQSFNSPYASPPQPRAPGSPGSVSSGNEGYQFQTMAPPPQRTLSTNNPAIQLQQLQPQTSQQSAGQALRTTPSATSNNPYRATSPTSPGSPEQQHPPYRPS